MERRRKTVSKLGLSPGTLVYTGDYSTQDQVLFQKIRFTETIYHEEMFNTVEECLKTPASPEEFTWILVKGVHNPKYIQLIGEAFNIHALSLEDILNVTHRPKFEEFESYVYLVLKKLSYNDRKEAVQSEQISILFGEHFLLTFQESLMNHFEALQSRLKKSKETFKKRKIDFLAYSVLDATVDHYLVVQDKLSVHIERLEEEILEIQGEAFIKRVQSFRQELLQLRKIISPVRDLVNGILRSDSPLIQEKNTAYVRDISDHIVFIIENIESFREMLKSLMELHLSTMSNHTNDIMKFLTMFTAIFIPLTYITGIYGMNFDYMPELKWRTGYLFVWVLNILIVMVLLLYFRFKKWL
jgi:magnesium transporter